jgi:hypothetical protein
LAAGYFEACGGKFSACAESKDVMNNTQRILLLAPLALMALLFGVVQIWEALTDYRAFKRRRTISAVEAVLLSQIFRRKLKAKGIAKLRESQGLVYTLDKLTALIRQETLNRLKERENERQSQRHR